MPQEVRFSSARLGDLACVVAVLAWFCWCYADATSYFFHWDDFWLLRDADRIGDWTNAWKVFEPSRMGFLLYRPLSQVGYMWAIGGIFAYDSAGYHAVQLLFNGANAVLVFAIGKRLFASRTPAVAAALLYAAAPGLAMSAYWNASFSAVGTAFWCLLCLFAWLSLPLARRAGICTAIYAVALLNGEQAAPWPLALAAAEALVPRDTGRRRWRSLVPIFVLAALAGMAKLAYLRWGLPVHFPDPMQRAVVLSHYGPQLSPVAAIKALGFYLAASTSWLYWAVGFAAGPHALGALVLAATAGLAWARRAPLAALGLILFLVPVLPLLAIPSHRYLYLAALPAAGVSLGIVSLVQRFARLPGVVLPLLAVATLGLQTNVVVPQVRQTDEFRFFEDFQVRAAGWLLAVDRQARSRPEFSRVAVPSNRVTKMIFADAGAHRFLLRANYEVIVVENPDASPPSADTLVVPRAPFADLRQPVPGQERRWDWLRTLGDRWGSPKRAPT